MDKLMKPAEYAKELGISRQAVYAKIKRGILTAKSVDGKLYIVVDKVTAKEKQAEVPKNNNAASTKAVADQSEHTHKDYQALLEAKDETIAVLKDTVKDLKESNRQISTTLRGEIDLLKEAFYEMRTLYVHQLGHDEHHQAIDVEEESPDEASVAEEAWIGIKKFFKQRDIRKIKQQEKIIKRLKKAYKKGDKRLLKEKGKIKINTAVDYKDLIE
jgi:predicted DNA-binding protein YlxM (UPF0122 family)